MAFLEKYKLEFYDRYDIPWTLRFYKNGWSGAVTTLRGGGVPITYDLLSESDEVFDPIKETQLNLSIMVEDAADQFAVRDICSLEQMETQVKLFQNNLSSPCYWRGWVDPSQYEEPYDVFPYEVAIVCIDGLSLLRDTPYAEQDSAGDTEYYSGRRFESQIILDILAEIGYTEFREYVNLYEEEMLDTVDYSPCNQVKIDANVFENKYCDEVLKNILVRYNACIRQDDGVFSIYRPKEIIDTTVYGRHFTAYYTKTSLSYTPTQFINRLTVASSLQQISGGVKKMIGPASKIKLYQDYGYKDSWINNWKFQGITFDDVTSKFEDWIYSAGGILPVLYTLKGESDGIVLPATTGGPGANPILYQSFGDYAESTTDVFVIEFEYFFASLIDAQDITFNIRIKADGVNNYLYPYDDIEAKWNVAADYLDYTEAVGAAVVTEWKTYKRMITGIPTTGSYTIGLYNGTSSVSNAFWGIKNIKFYCTSDKLSIKRTPRPTWFEYFWFGKLAAEGREAKKHPREVTYKDIEEIVIKEYIKTNDVNGIVKEYNCILGDVTDANIDNILEQFAGSLMISQRTLLARIDDVTLTSDTASGTANITVNGVTKTAVWNASLIQTALDFITNHNGDFTGVGVATGGDGVIKFTGVAGATLTVSIENNGINPDLTGSVANTQPDTYSDALTPSISWWKRQDELTGDLESSGNLAELLDLISDEIAEQYSRSKQLITGYPIQEITVAITSLNVIGNIQDDWNVDDSDFPVRSVSLWTLTACTLAISGSYVRYTSTDVDNYMIKSCNIKGSTHRYINIRYKIISGTLGTSQIYYSTVAHTYEGGYRKDFVMVNDGDWNIVTLDMSDLTSGGNDWMDYYITGIRIDLSEATDSIIDLDWIGFSRVFVINRGSFDIRNRQWRLDLMEIIR